MRRKSLLSLLFFFFAFSSYLWVFTDYYPVYAADTCIKGNPEPGKGGAVGDKCNADAVLAGVVTCCQAPDGVADESLFCMADKNSDTYNTCQRGFNQGGDKCSDDNDCDKGKNIYCVLDEKTNTKECREYKKCDRSKEECEEDHGDFYCTDKEDGACTDQKNCCFGSNLYCLPIAASTTLKTCQKGEVNACSKEGQACGKDGKTCCEGQNLACDNGKCVASCKKEGEQCNPAITTGGTTGDCCGNKNLTCDKYKKVSKDVPRCVDKDELKGAYSDEDPPPPPEPPCEEFNDDGSCKQVVTALGTLSTDPAAFIVTFFAVILSVSGGIAAGIIMLAGYKIMTSAGKPQAIQEGRDQLVAAIVGLLFIIFSFVILQVIGIDILRIPEDAL